MIDYQSLELSIGMHCALRDDSHEATCLEVSFLWICLDGPTFPYLHVFELKVQAYADKNELLCLNG